MDFSKVKRKKVFSPPLIAIYGPPGIGKTAFGVGAGKEDSYSVGKEEHLLVNIDSSGADYIDCIRATDLLGREINTIEDIKDIFKNIAEQEHSIKWMIFDDLFTLEEKFVKEVCEYHGVDDIKKVEYGKGYELARTKWTEFIKMITSLQKLKSIGIILIGHDKIETVRDPATETYSRHTLLLSKHSKEMLLGKLDFLGFAHKKTMTKSVDEGFGKKSNVPVGESQRILCLAPDNDSFESKSRLKLPEELPLEWGIFEDELIKAFQKGKEQEEEQEPKKKRK